MRSLSFQQFVLAIALLLASAVNLRAQSGSPVSSTDWPQWRGVNRDGHVASLPRTMPSLKLLWKQPAGNACDAGIAVAGGLVLVPDHDEKNDYYRCFDAAKGTEVWTRTFPNDREMDYGAGPRATPLVHGEKVYALGAFGDLHCFDLKTGKTLWEKNFLKDFGVAKELKWGYCSSPLIAGGKLIVNPGGKAAIAALDPETGKVLWEGEGGKANYSSFIAGTFGGVEQVVGHDDAALGGWDLATGKRLWSVPMEQGDGFIVPTPVNVGGKLLVTDQKNETQLFAFGKDGAINKEPAAKSEDLAPEVMTPVAARDMVIGVSKGLLCLDAANDLNALWSVKNEPAFKKNYCHLILAQDVGLAFSEGTAVLFTFNREGIKVLGKTKLCKKTSMHPTVAGDRLYARDSEMVYCFDLKP
jgi:outer membrane protein assembly factor BamB